MSKFIAYDINWDVDIDEIYDLLDDSTVAKAAELLEISPERYAAMTTEERHDYAYDKIRHNRLDAAEMVGLPDEVEIPEDILEYYEITSVDDDMSYITDWLSDEYGYCINGYEVAEKTDLMYHKLNELYAGKNITFHNYPREGVDLKFCKDELYSPDATENYTPKQLTENGLEYDPDIDYSSFSNIVTFSVIVNGKDVASSYNIHLDELSLSEIENGSFSELVDEKRTLGEILDSCKVQKDKETKDNIERD